MQNSQKTSFRITSLHPMVEMYVSMCMRAGIMFVRACAFVYVLVSAAGIVSVRACVFYPIPM